MEGPTPPAVLEFFLYTKSSRDTLPEFLAHYERLFKEANAYGVSPMVGIDQLIPLLPYEWQDWATSIIPHHSCPTYLGSHYASVGGFIGDISTQYYVYGAPPPAPSPPAPFPPPVFQPGPEHDLATFVSEPSTPITQVVPNLSEVDAPGFAQDLPVYDPFDSPLDLGLYSTSNGVLDHDEDVAAASDAGADLREGDDGDEADDEEEDPEEDDPAP